MAQTKKPTGRTKEKQRQAAMRVAKEVAAKTGNTRTVETMKLIKDLRAAGKSEKEIKKIVQARTREHVKKKRK